MAKELPGSQENDPDFFGHAARRLFSGALRPLAISR